MFEEPLVKHFISNAFDKDGKGSASSCFGDAFHMIKKVHVIFGKQKHLEKKKKLREKSMHEIGPITIDCMQSGK